MNRSIRRSHHFRSTLFAVAGILLSIFLILFRKSFVPGQALFSNDGPFALQSAEAFEMPRAFFGIWYDLYWLGANVGNFLPNLSGLAPWCFGPLGCINYFVPLALIIVGLCAAFFFRQLGFSPGVSILGGIAAGLNGNFFSNACWGLPSRATCLAMTFLALAALWSSLGRWTWVKAVLAGFAVGLSITEGGDNGAFFSLFVASFGVAISFFYESGPFSRRASRSISRVLITAVCAGIIAAQTLNVFATTSVKGIVGTQQDQQTKEEKWIGNTLWSLPKVETLRLIIPGLHGYRMDTPNGGNYWGAVGAQPGFPQSRYSGAGEYAGVLVVLIACWAVGQAFFKTGNPFSPAECRMIFFWFGAAVIGILLAWGRFAPLGIPYRLIYALPYFSTIRNPMKLMHPAHMAIIILFAYGMHGMAKKYLSDGISSPAHSFRTWWIRARGFERAWTWLSLALVCVSAFGWFAYLGMRQEVVRYLKSSGFGDDILARQIAAFSSREVFYFVIVLTISAVLVLSITAGKFRGAKARWGLICLGAILIVDLARANIPWIQYYDYRVRYATNPVIETLRADPPTQRVAFAGFKMSQPQAAQAQDFLNQVYRVEWLQHHFQYYNIPSLDVSQMPRTPEDYSAFNQALGRVPLRLWQLTNTRYVLGLASMTDGLNQQLDPVQRSFYNRLLFTFIQEGKSLSVVTNQEGPFALIGIKSALPRVKLYSHWQTETNSSAVLAKLSSPTFDPAQELIVSDQVAESPSLSNPPDDAVTFKSYIPQHLTFRCSATNASVLLLNDRYDAAWKVFVDGQPAQLLRCNFVMRGVSVPAGIHEVEFRFKPPLTGLWLMLGCEMVGLALCGFLWYSSRGRVEPA